MKTLLAGLIMIAGLVGAEEGKTNIWGGVSTGIVCTLWGTNGIDGADYTNIYAVGVGSGEQVGVYLQSATVDPYSIQAMQNKDVITNVINELAKAGEICKVFGHQWRGGRPGEGWGWRNE